MWKSEDHTASNRAQILRLGRLERKPSVYHKFPDFLLSSLSTSDHEFTFLSWSADILLWAAA